MAKSDVVDRNLAIALELRAAAEETRRALQLSRDLVERSRLQSEALSRFEFKHTVGVDYCAPSGILVDCLIRAYEIAEHEGEPETRALLSHVLMHVGRRLAAGSDMHATKIVMH